MEDNINDPVKGRFINLFAFAMICYNDSLNSKLHSNDYLLEKYNKIIGFEPTIIIDNNEPVNDIEQRHYDLWGYSKDIVNIVKFLSVYINDNHIIDTFERYIGSIININSEVSKGIIHPNIISHVEDIIIANPLLYKNFKRKLSLNSLGVC